MSLEIEKQLVVEMMDDQHPIYFQERLAEKYKYKPLPEEIRTIAINYYLQTMPKPFKKNMQGLNSIVLTSKQDIIISQGYTRVVIGDYGAFVEIDESAIDKNILTVPEKEKYRIYDPKYKDNVKYHWYTLKKDPTIKIYYQVKPVNYADYIPGKYYISVHELSYVLFFLQHDMSYS